VAHTPFTAEVLTPEGSVFKDEVELVSTFTTVGSIGIMAGHEPVLARLEPTELRLYRSESEIVRYAQAEGYLQVAHGRVLVLVDEAVEPARLDVAALQDRVATARHALEAAEEGSEQAGRAQADLRRAEAFLAIAQGAR
jgi:F-type H+-transporting ATPase subunit epsilon